MMSKNKNHPTKEEIILIPYLSIIVLFIWAVGIILGLSGKENFLLLSIIISALPGLILFLKFKILQKKYPSISRNKIKNFASTVSLEGGRKYVILDEADYLNPQSTQPALRGFMEEFHKNCGFILTCNYKNRLIEPLHSRCSVVDFVIAKDDKPKLAKDFFVRVKNILEEENIKYEPRVIMEVLTKYFPDWRRTLNELQRYSTSGQIDAGILVNISEVNINELITALKAQEFTNVRKWIVHNLDNDPVRIYRRIYDNLYNHATAGTIPHAVLILSKYQYQSAFVADQEINLLACLTEIMVDVKWK